MIEIVAIGVVLALALALARPALGRRALVVGALVVGALALGRARRSPRRDPAPLVGPSTTLGYVSSNACRACHPAEHASFARTYHRTMTQRATPASVLAPFERREGEVWADGRRVVMTTGSHREQQYWAREDGELRLLPHVWLVEEQTLVPRREAFLQPPDAPEPRIRWASNCIACHAVAGEPRHDPSTDRFDARAAELGIACEACHGPGRAHVERHRDPFERWSRHASRDPDPTIVHPRRLPADRSVALCGQCHAYAFPRDEADWWAQGYAQSFRAGDHLEPSRFLLDPRTLEQPGAPVIEAPVASLFWADGSVRVGGREYAGLVASACYARGAGDRTITCLSCHAMHAGDPSGQLAPGRTDDAMCTSCHARDEHSHHSSVSCVACHMPKTSYALLRSVRSHRIDRPRVQLGKPNACNLCHLDESLAWTGRWLETWYGVKSPLLPESRRDVPSGVFDGIAGDAATRALVADVSRDRALLERMTDDRYAAVRFIARRSLSRADTKSSKKIETTLLRALEAQRDDRPVSLAE